MRRLPYALALLGVALLVTGLALVGGARDTARAWRAELARDAQAQASSFGAALDRAGSVALLLAQNPAFATDLRTEAERAPAELALDYLSVLYSYELEAASLLDEEGHELLRVDDGDTVPRALRQDGESQPWFAPTMALPSGEVHQGPPHRSERSGAWVISTTTWIPHGDTGSGRLLVHLELDVDSFARFFPASRGRHTALVEGVGGHIVLRDGRRALHEDEASEAGWSHDLLAHAEEGRAVDVDGDTVAVSRVRVLEQGTELSLADGERSGWYAVIWSEGDGVPPTWRGGAVAVTGLVLVCLALGAFRRQQSFMRSVVRRDHLTGLVNRKAFEEALSASLAATRPARDPGLNVGVLLIDLDGFKQVNDTLGHDRGDQVLQEVARRLEQAVGDRDTAARLGGDEFAVVLGQPRTADEVVALAGRLRDALVRPFVLDGAPRFVGASVGVSLHPEHAATAEDLLRQADAAMYQAKRNHEGVRLYTPGTEGGAETLELAADLQAVLEDVLDDDRLRMVFQPLFSPDGRRIEAVEGLARWTAADGRPVPPREFVAMAEETGLIRDLTVSTFRLALDAAASWRAAGAAVPVSLNVSASVLGDPGLPALVAELLAEHGLPGDALVVEVTDRAFATAPVDLLPVLDELAATGVRLRLDDFGSGHVSFADLRRLPFEAVKLDLTPLAVDAAGSVRVLTAVVELVHSLDLPVLVEGVEDQATWDAVREVGCDGVQGFHLAPPMAASDLRDLLAARPDLLPGPSLATVPQGM